MLSSSPAFNHSFIFVLKSAGFGEIFSYLSLDSFAFRMGRLNLNPSRVYQTATQILESKQIILKTPPWYLIMGAIPPGEILTRPQPVQHRDVSQNRQTKKPSKMFKPQPITHEEDRLRKVFYRDHPWELARPRVILEEDGKDGQNCDWSTIQQQGRPLNAESVVQRQLWLLHNEPGISSTQAYDQARREFYLLRHEEDIERRVAKEEALSTGAYFGKSMLEVGMELEDQSFESWKEWASKEIEVIDQQKNSAYTSTPEEAEDDLDVSGSEAHPAPRS